MKLNKKCPCCGVGLTTKKSKFIGKTSEVGMVISWFNCKLCGSTFILKKKDVL